MFARALWLVVVIACIPVAQGKSLTLQDLWELSVAGGGSSDPMSVTGTILATDAAGGLVALEDQSRAVILSVQLPAGAWPQLQVGKSVQFDFPASRFFRRGLRIDCVGAPLIDADGLHPPTEKSGTVFLTRGKHPLGVEWFNGRATSVLSLAMEGPGFQHEVVPAEWLSHDGGKPGLRFERFRIDGISSLDQVPEEGGGDLTGSVTKIDHSAGEGLENVALRFSGMLEVPSDGTYTFRMRCDDGARLSLGAPQAAWKILPDLEPVKDSLWREVEGTVSFASKEGARLRLEVATDQKRSELTVLNPAGLDPWVLMGRYITAQGIAYEGGVCVLSAGHLRLEPSNRLSAPVLASAVQVRELQPDETAKYPPVVLRGVVTMVNYRSLVLQDDSGGVFVLAQNMTIEPPPEVGERWIVEGEAAPGDFSPIVVAKNCRFLSSGALPLPRRPNWEEFQNGSVDAEMVEIEGVIISLGADRAELLTRDGTTVLQSTQFYPLPVELLRPTATSLVGARVKLRGVFATSWDRHLGRLTPGVFSLGNATLSVVELAPQDPGLIPLVTVPDLWKFTTQSTALNRVRLRGQLMARRDDTLLVSAGAHTLRLASDSAHGAVPGDEVEVVGFARTGAISPLIVHPVLRVLSQLAMPQPIEQDPAELPDLKLDGKLLRMQGRVISDTIQSGQRRLELESGAQRFFAIGPHSMPGDATFLRDSVVQVDGVYFAMNSDPLSMGQGDFEIRMMGDDALQLIAQPSWWSTRRLLLLVAVLFGGLSLVLGWVGILQRVVKKRTSELAVEIAKKEHAETERALELERARVARDLHDELGAGLTEIGLLGSLMGNPAIPATAKSNYVNTLGDVSRSLVSALDEIVWAINPDYDSVDDLAAYLWLHAQRLLNPAGIACDPVKPVDIPSRSLGSRSRHSLLLAFKEALNNVIKHSGATRVDLGVRVEADHLIVSIADNGSGIAAGDVPRPGSQGIVGLRERMHDLDGGCEIVANPGGGTVVTFTLPLRSP
ncbi:PA14 domain-containing protein [Luteolibacter flavescens]|uniref:PA14 domain-containing protein n=1 Tax=Luteolibacter flavescens TaxID=1859460 RepID=A0ABT3FSB6_9BACT|nr:ATP-binding protein [Luteolibacter flavescens]MCW1886342.1 PA14 domain-containing protein [Luteolibacter flavescens]